MAGPLISMASSATARLETRQLGHADWSVTARHYARWTGGDRYVEPERLLPGEVPADLLARFRADTASRGNETKAAGDEDAA
jgi:hypothetical protein